MQTTGAESFIATRDLRVACGEDGTVVDVKRGEPWPDDARARLDVLLKVGHVVRFDEHGEPDKRSRKFVQRLGLPKPLLYHQRTFAARARAEAQLPTIAGRKIRVFAGRRDDDLGDLFVVNGRAYSLRRGVPDGPMAAGAPSTSKGGARRASGRRPGEKRRRRQQTPKA
jgi:hypothetical protein